MREPALLLIGHGSSNPDWRKPLDRVHDHVRELAPDRQTRLCFLDHTEPDFETAVAELVAAGVRRIRVVAVLLSSTGKHFRSDIPELVAAARIRHEGLTIHTDPEAVGTHDAVIRAMAASAVAGLDQ